MRVCAVTPKIRYVGDARTAEVYPGTMPAEKGRQWVSKLLDATVSPLQAIIVSHCNVKRRTRQAESSRAPSEDVEGQCMKIEVIEGSG